MEETEATSFGFNKRRAEGRDKTDLPKKNLQLKVRKLNPANTISYVQVQLGCFFLVHVFDFLTGFRFICSLKLYLNVTRYWELEWILKIRRLRSCFSLINKDSFLMLERY